MRDFYIIKEYQEILDESFIPQRADESSAGYDFKAAEDIIVPSIINSYRKMRASLLYRENHASNVDEIEEIEKLLYSNTVFPLSEIEKINKEYNFKATMIPTGIKARMDNNNVLKIYPRSSTGCKSLLTLPNNVGIIDASYYNNPDNEGHIYIPVINLSPFDILIKKGDRIAQGIFVDYYTTKNDLPQKKSRDGGFGSSGR